MTPRVTGVVDRDAYKIEKIIFQSRPEFLVTANLYIPKGRKFPLPAVVGTCGHSNDGKAQDVYQSYAQGLARLGYVVLIYDPLGQGERLQYPNGKGGSRVGVGVREHLLAGNQQFLVGDFLGTWRAWDGIRALDYLLTREEVDPKRVGVTGNSGGGTMTTWLCGLEDRWAMAAPSCFVTTFRRNMENELPADTEQCPPARWPCTWITTISWPRWRRSRSSSWARTATTSIPAALREAYARLKRLYRLLGAEENVALFVGSGPHGYSQDNREAMYRWFHRAAGLTGDAAEPKLTIEKEQTLWCTPQGQVAELKSRSVFSFTSAKSQALAKDRPRLDGEKLQRAVAEVLKLPPREGVPEFRILRSLPSRKYPKSHCTTYAVETEPGIHALVYLLGERAHESSPPRGRQRAVLYVAHESSDAELRDEPFAGELVKAEPAAAFYACDVRGLGESLPNTCGANTYRDPYGCDYFYAIHSIMLDYPYLGQRTFDVLRVLDWLKNCGHAEVHLAARGFGTLPATFAAVLAPQVVRLTLRDAPKSFAEIAETEDYRWPLSSMLPGVLQRFDLPDCYRALCGEEHPRLTGGVQVANQPNRLERKCSHVPTFY